MCSRYLRTKPLYYSDLVRMIRCDNPKENVKSLFSWLFCWLEKLKAPIYGAFKRFAIIRTISHRPSALRLGALRRTSAEASTYLPVSANYEQLRGLKPRKTHSYSSKHLLFCVRCNKCPQDVV